jgi:hypothetical protein
MSNLTPIHKIPYENNPVIYKHVSCLICMEKIEDKTAAKCVQCNIYMHSYCSSRWRDLKKYSQCPHCSSVGLIGKVYNYIDL